MARLKTKQISDFTTAVQSLIDNDTDQNAGLIDALEASVDSLESATGGDTTAINSSIDSLETLVAADASDADASIDSLETLVGADAADADASIDSLETAVTGNDGDITNLGASVDSLETVVGADAADADASIDSLETALNGFAKEAFIHLAVTGLVSGNGATTAVLDTAGSNNGDNVTENAGEYVFDLAVPMEAANAIEGEAGLIDLQINGLGVDHSAVRWNNANSFSILESQLGYVLEASDRVEFKYIRD